MTSDHIIQMFRDNSFSALETNLSQNETELEGYIERFEDETGKRVHYPPGRHLERGVELEDLEFAEWLKGEVLQSAEEVAMSLLESLDADGLLLWRAVVAPAAWNPYLAEHVGVHWSFTQEKAQPIFGNQGEGDKVFVIEARVALTSVDWDATLSSNLSEEFGEDEDEVTLIEGAPYKIQKVYQMVGGQFREKFEAEHPPPEAAQQRV